MSHRFCVLPGRHLREKILGICLEEACSSSSLLCRYCYSQNHEGHLIMTLDFLETMTKEPSSMCSIKEMDKMGRQAEEIYKMIDESCKTLILASTSKLTQNLESNKKPCLDMISSNIQPIQIDEIYKNLSTSKVIPQELMHQYLTKLRVFYFEGSCSQSEIEHKKWVLRSNLAEFFKRSQQEIEAVLDNLREKILQYHTESFALQNQKEVKLEEQEYKLQTVLGKNPAQIKQMKNQQKHKQSSTFNKNTTNVTSLVAQPQKVVLRQTKECSIAQGLYSFDILAIKQLTLINTAGMCAIDKISAIRVGKMINLRALRIYWARGLTDATACSMLKGLTNLVELVLSEFDHCTPFFVNALKINNPRLKRVCFSLDIVHFVQPSEDSMEFLPDTAYIFPPERSWITLSTELKELQSLELHKPENVHHWANFMSRKADKIKQFSLLDLDAVLQNQQKLIEDDINYSIILRSLQKCRNLRSLRFEQASFDQKSLVRIIQANPHLLTFIASQCSTFKGRTYQALSKCCKHLKELSVIMDDRLIVQNFWGMTSLKTLVLRGCWGIHENKFIDSLPKLQNIQCLSIDHNKQWVTGKTLRALHKLPKLEILNLSFNDLSIEDAQGFKHIPPLRTLICAGNRFGYFQLIQCPFSKDLKKLSIGKNRQIFPEEKSYEKIKMAMVAQNFPSLTHLKLNGFKNIKADFLALLSRLICLSFVDCQHADYAQCKKFCKANEIRFHTSDSQ